MAARLSELLFKKPCKSLAKLKVQALVNILAKRKKTKEVETV